MQSFQQRRSSVRLESLHFLNSGRVRIVRFPYGRLLATSSLRSPLPVHSGISRSLAPTGSNP